MNVEPKDRSYRRRRAPIAPPARAVRDDMVNRASNDVIQGTDAPALALADRRPETLRVQGSRPPVTPVDAPVTSRTTALCTADQLGEFLVFSELIHEDRWNQAVEKAGKKNLHLLLEELAVLPGAEDDFSSTHLLRERRLTRYQIEQILSGAVSGLVLGPFIFRKRLGRGGMADVLQAYNKELDRLEAVKVLRNDKARSGIDLAALVRREARVLASLVHPNITTVYRADTTHGTTFLSMEYIPGETVETKVSRLTKRGEYLPVRESVRIALEASFALAYAHSRHVIHRDVKPGNVMVTPDNRVKMLDVGIAALFAPEKEESFGKGATKELSTLKGFGTPHYVAPEQWEHNQTTESVDVYGLGATLFHMLVGRPPFMDKDLEVLLARKRDGAVNPATLRREVPFALGQVVQKALAGDPSHRYASMEAFAAALLPFSEEKPPDVAPQIPWLGVVGVLALSVIAIRMEPRVVKVIPVKPETAAPMAAVAAAPAKATAAPVKAPTEPVAASPVPVQPKHPIAKPVLDVAAIRDKTRSWLAPAAIILKNGLDVSEQVAAYRRQAEEVWEASFAASRAGDAPKALASIERALKLAPDSPRLLEDRAAALRKLGREEEAANAFEKAAQKSPAEAKRLRGEAAAALLRWASHIAEEKQFKKADDILQDAAQRYADRAAEFASLHREVLIQWATELAASGKDAAAVPIVAKARAAAPDRPEPIKLQALLSEKARDWKAAAEAWLDWGKAAQNEPTAAANAAAAWRHWGLEAAAQSDQRTAVERFERARRLQPGDPETASHLAVAHNLLGFALHQRGDEMEAVAEYSRALEATPRSAVTYRNRGFSQLQLKNYDAALRDYTKSIELDPGNDLAFRMRGAIRLLNLPEKDWKAILADLGEAARLNSGDPKTNYYLAFVYANCPDKAYRNATKAVEHAERACKATKYADWEHLAMLAAAYAAAEKTEAALARIEQAERLAPEKDKPDLKNLAEAYRSKK